jgi:DHA1 family tetracycline resistance protein-like MFS transporter
MTSTRNALVFIFVTRLIDAIGFGIVMPVMPRLLMSIGNLTLADAARTGGALVGAYAVLQFFCGPLMGNLSDRFGRRPVILGSLMAYAIDYAVMGFAPSVGWLFLGRAIAGVAGAVYAPANAFIADITPPERRAQAFGRIGAAFGLGFILGPALGGLLGELGPRAPFLAAAALAACNLAFGWFVLPESLPAARRRPFALARANPLGALLALGRFPGVMAIGLALLLWQTAQNVYPSTWSFFAIAKFNWSPGLIGLSLACTGIGMAVVQAGLTGRVVARFGEARAAMIGMGVAALAFFGYAFATEAWMVFALLFFGALQALAYPSLTAMMSRAVPADQQGELQGGVAGLASLASIIGPFLMTQTLAAFSGPLARVQFPGAAFMLSGALVLVCFALLRARLVQKTVRHVRSV